MYVYVFHYTFYFISQMIIYCKQFGKCELVEFAFSHVYIGIYTYMHKIDLAWTLFDINYI